MGYNVLSGSVSSIRVISSGSFVGDGAGLENVKQFELYNSGDSRVPFYKLVSGKLEFDGNAGFSYNNTSNALTIPAITSSAGIRLSNPISGALAGNGSFIGIDTNGNMILTSSAAGTGPSNSLQFHTSGGLISGSSNFSFAPETNILTANCGLVFKRQQITSTMTASVADYFIGVSASSAIIIQMPGAQTLSSGQMFIIKDEGGNAGNYNITIKSSGSQTIDGETSIILESPFSSINLYTNGSDKFFIY